MRFKRWQVYTNEMKNKRWHDSCGCRSKSVIPPVVLIMMTLCLVMVSAQTIPIEGEWEPHGEDGLWSHWSGHSDFSTTCFQWVRQAACYWGGGIQPMVIANTHYGADASTLYEPPCQWYVYQANTGARADLNTWAKICRPDQSPVNPAHIVPCIIEYHGSASATCSHEEAAGANAAWGIRVNIASANGPTMLNVYGYDKCLTSFNANDAGTIPYAVPAYLCGYNILMQLSVIVNAGANGWYWEYDSVQGVNYRVPIDATAEAQAVADPYIYIDPASPLADSYMVFILEPTNEWVPLVKWTPTRVRGTVTDQYNSQPIPGIIMDLYDASGMTLLASTETDSVGFYKFNYFVDNGDTIYLQSEEEYQVWMVTPQGYCTNDITHKPAIVPAEIAFTAYSCDENYAKGMGYWKHQVNKALQGNPHDYTAAEMLAFLDVIHTEWDCYDNVLTLVDMKDVFDSHQGMDEQAARHILALALNIAAGKISQGALIDLGDLSPATTVGEAMLDAEGVLLDPLSTHSDYERAKDIAEMLNNMEGFITTGGPQSWGSSQFELSMLRNVIPNPFSMKTSISYSVAKSEHISLKIYNTAGQLIHTLVYQTKDPGYYTVEWNGSPGCCGRPVPSGVYLLKFDAGEVTETRKLVIAR